MLYRRSPAQGHPLYHGPAAQAVDWFDCLGYALPYRVNAADFILDLASGDVASGGRGGEESRALLEACAERFLAGQRQAEGFDAARHAAQLRQARWV